MKAIAADPESEYLALLEAQFAAAPFDAFIRQVSPQLPPPAHLAPIRRLIERTRNEEVRALISAPPRHGKSISLTHGLAWRTLLDPACLNAYTSYGEDLSRSHSRMARRLAIEAGVEIASDSSSVTDWRTTAGGGVVATGVGGPLTGKGITGILVCDDLLKNREEAESATRRKSVIEWFGDVAFTRLEAGSSVIVCATRWHEDDLIGHLRASFPGEWEEVVLPAVADEHGRAADERIQPDARALWPEMFPLEKLAQIRRTLGEYGWWSLYQAEPRPRGGRLFGEPSRFDADKLDIAGCRVAIICDPAASAKTHADYSAIAVVGMRGFGDETEMFVLHVERHQVTIPVLCRRLEQIQRQWDAVIGVEAVGGFKAVPQMLRDANPSLCVVELPVRGDKFQRAQPLLAAWNGGRVHVPVSAPWLGDYLAEMRAFTGAGDAHDDQLDVTAHGWNALYREKPDRVARGARVGVELPFG